jgi:hypothetical protein
MDTTKSSAPHAHPSTEDHDDTVEAHYASLEREPEACLCYDDATAGLHEDPDPTTVAGLSPAVKDLFLVWDAYEEGWTAASGELPF